MMRPVHVLYFAPGSGLGHLNRALALGVALRERGITSEIVTNSPFAEGVARTVRFPITSIQNQRWAQAAREYARYRNPRLAVIDTFPFGLRGEWINFAWQVPFVYVARRLRVAQYRAAIPAPQAWPSPTATILAEPLDAEQEQWIRESGSPLVRLPGPIRLKPGSVETPVPLELERKLDTGRLWLVVHSGIVSERRRLWEIAKERCLEFATIAPGAGSHHEYFPVCNLVGRAAGIVSGAGYNVIADMMDRRDRHVAIAFERRFDDQAGRLAARRDHPAEGTPAAAAALAAFL